MAVIAADKVEKYKQGMQLVMEGMYIRKASAKVGVPRENLRARVAGDVPSSASLSGRLPSNINGLLFRHWVKLFAGRLPAARPQLLILDGHFAHIDYDTVVWANLATCTCRIAGTYVSLLTAVRGLIGNKPTTTKKSLRHHATVVPHVEALQVSERQQRGLKRQGLDIDALNVVNIAVIYRAPSTKKRSTGTYVDELFSVGVLLTHDKMLVSLEREKTPRLTRCGPKTNVQKRRHAQKQRKLKPKKTSQEKSG
ncbi:hypothetical protein GQ600_27478 [Phytophthora cactorum]|nr:hypothetical protein GQ600_27478 [Phytophthora cactorum]